MLSPLTKAEFAISIVPMYLDSSQILFSIRCVLDTLYLGGCQELVDFLRFKKTRGLTQVTSTH